MHSVKRISGKMSDNRRKQIILHKAERVPTSLREWKTQIAFARRMHLVRCMQNDPHAPAIKHASERMKRNEETAAASYNKHNKIIVFSDPAGRSSRIVDRIKRYELYA